MATAIETQSGLRILAAHLAPIRALAGAETDDGHGLILSAGGDDMIRAWDATTGERYGFAQTSEAVVKSLEALAVAVTTLPNGLVMIAGGGEDKTIHRWNAATGEHIGDALTGHQAWVVQLGFISMPQGSVVLASVDDEGQVRRWDAISGEPFGEPFAAGGEEITSLRLAVADAVQPPQLLTAGDDQVVRRWDATSGQLLEELRNTTCATAVTLVNGRTLLAVGAADGSISIGPLPAGSGNSST